MKGWLGLLAIVGGFMALRQRPGNVQQVARDTLDQLTTAGNPIPGTATLETLLPVLPAGPLKEVAVAILANASPTTEQAGEESAAGHQVDVVTAQAAVNDLAEHVEPAAIALALTLANGGVELTERKVLQLLPVPTVAVRSLLPQDVAAAIRENLTTLLATDPTALAFSLPSAESHTTVTPNADGTTTTMIQTENADGTSTVVQVTVGPGGSVLSSSASTSAPQRATSGGANVMTPEQAAAMFPVWTGAYRALMRQVDAPHVTGAEALLSAVTNVFGS